MRAEPLEAPRHSGDFEEQVAEIRRQQARSLVAHEDAARNQGGRPPPADVTPDDDEELLTGRGRRSGRLFDIPDDVSAEQETSPRSAGADEVEEAKAVIMDELERKHREQSRQLPIRAAELERGRLRERETLAPARLPAGRRRLVDAVERASDLTGQMDSVAFAKKKLERESALRRAALENCFGAKHFRDYLESQNAAIPESLAAIPRARQRGPPRPRKVAQDI
jgi:hypothetical protein